MPRLVSTEELFKGRHFDEEIVVLCVRWYLSFKLSFRDLVAMMGERGIGLAHTTILRWVQHYTQEFEKRWERYARAVVGSWRMDETYVKMRGEWVYLYRAVDKAGKTVDFYLSRKRDVDAGHSLSAQSNEGPADPHEDHAGCLRCLTPCSHRFESDRRVAEARASTDQQVSEQRH
jgi:transposase-like protein